MTEVDRLLPRCSFPPPGTPVVCAWSGGPDSTALVALAQAAGCRVSGVHIDHGLRAQSADEADAVRLMAGRLSVPVSVIAVALDDGPNLEARARQARAAALPADALLGHTADDQAETVLLHLARGAGPAGLAAMAATRRPLLGLRRTETRAVCDELGLTVVDDPSNHDPRFRRNRVRHELLPLMAEIFERDPVPILTRTAGHQRDMADLLDALAGPIDVTDTRVLQELHPAVARHALRQWLRDGTDSPYGADAATIDRVMAIVTHDRRAAEIGARWRVSRHDGRLRLDRTESAEHVDPVEAR